MIVLTTVVVTLAAAALVWAIAVRGRRRNNVPDVGAVSDRWLMAHGIER